MRIPGCDKHPIDFHLCTLKSNTFGPLSGLHTAIPSATADPTQRLGVPEWSKVAVGPGNFGCEGRIEHEDIRTVRRLRRRKNGCIGSAEIAAEHDVRLPAFAGGSLKAPTLH